MRRWLGVWLIAQLWAHPAAAERRLSGSGRVGAAAGWRLAFNERYYRAAAERGYSPSPGLQGGPMLLGLFGYSASELIEVSIEPFVSTEQLALVGGPSLRTITYGALLGARLQVPLGDLYPSAGVVTGPTLVYATGSGQTGSLEQLGQSFGLALGLTWRLGDEWGVGLEYRLMAGTGVRTSIGEASRGGHWLGASLTRHTAPSPPRDFPLARRRSGLP